MISDKQLKVYAEKCYNKVEGYTLTKAATLFPKYFPKILYYYTLLAKTQKEDIDKRNIYFIFSFQLQYLKVEYTKLEAERISNLDKFIKFIEPEYIEGESIKLSKPAYLEALRDFRNSTIPIVKNLEKTYSLCEQYDIALNNKELTRAYDRSLGDAQETLNTIESLISTFEEGGIIGFNG